MGYTESMQYKNIDEYLWKTRTRDREFADMFKISISHVSLLRRGLRTPSLKLALRISKKTGIKIEGLIN